MATPAVEIPRKLSYAPLIWFSVLVLACYLPVITSLVRNWEDPDMGHGYFVPVIAGFIIWQRREELFALKPQPSKWGVAVLIFGALQLICATLGVELFLARSALIITIIGIVWALGGTLMLKKLAFPLFLLFFMVPIPTIAYTRITFPLQLLASRLAENALTLLDIPVLREGNILELPNQRLSVVEACSGIRSLLSLSFLSLVYGYFFESRIWVRTVLFFSTIPIAIIANGSRVTLTGVMTQVKPELAEGFFHESTGWVIFMVALAIMVIVHQAIVRTSRFVAARRRT